MAAILFWSDWPSAHKYVHTADAACDCLGARVHPVVQHSSFTDLQALLGAPDSAI